MHVQHLCAANEGSAAANRLLIAEEAQMAAWLRSNFMTLMLLLRLAAKAEITELLAA